MNKKAQIWETVGAIVLLVGTVFGGINVIKDIFEHNYIADMSAQDNGTSCVYEVSCQKKIGEIPQELRKGYKSLKQANKDNFILCPCD